MEGFTFDGSFDDGGGREQITWRAGPADRKVPGFELRTVIRDVAFCGHDFDNLKSEHPARAVAAGLRLSRKTGELRDCVLTGDLPCEVEDAGARSPGVVTFSLDLHLSRRNRSSLDGGLRLRTAIHGVEYEVVNAWFEDGLLALGRSLPAGIRLVCCLTCLLSDYWPGGHGLTGMHCHRDSRERYLAVRSKRDYFEVPVTEIVMETYLCPEYEPRVPGTGYRG